MLPGTGELVNLDDQQGCVLALRAVRDFESQLREAKALLTEAIVDHSQKLGVKSFTLGDGTKAEVRGGPEATYDVAEIEEKLRALGMPEDRIREIVVEQIEYKLSVREAKRAASANADYASVIDNAKTVEAKPYYVSISRQR